MRFEYEHDSERTALFPLFLQESPAERRIM